MPVTPVAAPDLADCLKQRWRAGSTPDLGGALRDHPTLLRHRSLVLDLAFEAYALREEAGPAPDPESFCRDLPAYRSDVRDLLRDYRALQDNPHVLKGFRFPEPGETFERCEVVRELGHGAFARAYLATDPDTGGRRVVLKLSATASVEGKALGQLRHPHVAEVLWARPVGDGSAVCLLYRGAATLLNVVAAAFAPEAGPPTARTVLDAIDEAGAGLPPPNGPLPPPLLGRGGSYADAVGRIAGKLAGALAYLHAEGQTHGDLKPSNIVLAAGGHPYLIDFNLSGRAGEKNRYGGTLPYLAPERVGRLLDPGADAGDGRAADVYAFGAVLHEALTGRVPFPPLEGGDLKEIAADLHRRQLAVAPRLRAVGVPRGLARLVDECLAADPARRPTAAELDRRLGRYVRRRVRRARVALAVVTVLVGSAVAWVAMRSGGGLPPAVIGQPLPAPAELVTAEDFMNHGFGLLGEGQWDRASDAFREAFKHRQDGRTTALMGYCRTRLGEHERATKLYLAAMTSGYRPAWVHNNRAYGFVQWKMNTPKELGPAVTEADAALALDGDLDAARFNRACARYYQHLVPGEWVLNDPEAVAAIEADLGALLAKGPLAPALYLRAAQVWAASAAGDPARLARAVEHLQAARHLGLPLPDLKRDPILSRWLGERPDFLAVASAPAGTPAGALVDPGLAHPPAH